MSTRPVHARVAPWLLLALMALAGSGHAEDDKRSAQLREAAKRAQAAAQQAQQEAAGLRAERDKLASDDAARKSELAQAEARGRTASAQALTLKSSLSRAEAERDALKAALAKAEGERDALQARLDKTQTEAQASASALDEQRRVTQNVATLLQGSVKSLAAAEDTNRQLQALGLQALAAYEGSTPEAQRARDEPFLGLGSVRLANDAEVLRRSMGALKLTP